MEDCRDTLEGSVKFDANGLVPCVVQEWRTGEVLMLAYMNGESLRRTMETGLTWFWSRSRGEYWNKGGTSGHVQRVKELRYDCDGDTLLALVEQAGPACHTGTHSCFDERRLFPSATLSPVAASPSDAAGSELAGASESAAAPESTAAAPRPSASSEQALDPPLFLALHDVYIAALPAGCSGYDQESPATAASEVATPGAELAQTGGRRRLEGAVAADDLVSEAAASIRSELVRLAAAGVPLSALLEELRGRHS